MATSRTVKRPKHVPLVSNIWKAAGRNKRDMTFNRVFLHTLVKDTKKNTEATLKYYALHCYVGTVFSRDKLLA